MLFLLSVTVELLLSIEMHLRILRKTAKAVRQQEQPVPAQFPFLLDDKFEKWTFNKCNWRGECSWNSRHTVVL
jgi:hypothetical protein